MSGRSKGAPASPEEEREQLRQLTREAHEAAKDARAAIRELRAEREEFRQHILETVAGYGDAVLAELSEQFRKSRETLEHFEGVVENRTAAAVDEINHNHAQLMGFKTPDEFSDWLLDRMSCAVIEGLAGNPVFIREVGLLVVQHGYAAGRAARIPQVLVATQESLDAYVAAGGNPGMIIDARET